jgi:hypothetical protein
MAPATHLTPASHELPQHEVFSIRLNDVEFVNTLKLWKDQRHPEVGAILIFGAFYRSGTKAHHH